MVFPANKMIAAIFKDKVTGATTLEKLKDRGEYNASDAQYMTAMNSQRKEAALKDMGIELLKNVYFQVYDIQEYKETADDKNKSKTYTISGTAYLYKVDLDAILTSGTFWDLIDYEKPDLNKQNNLQNYDFSITPVLQTSVYSTASNLKGVKVNSLISNMVKKQGEQKDETINYRTEKEINLALLDKLVNSADINFSKNFETFKVKVPVYNADPLTIKVGKKESLRIDHLYLITENRIDKKGNKYTKKIGWVRAKHVSDNKRNADGKTEPSLFYKTYSKNIQKGMGATYAPETGLVIGASYNLGNSLMSGYFINAEYITHFWKGFRIGLSAGGFNDQVETNPFTYDNGNTSPFKFKGTNTYFDLVFSQTLQANRIELIPFIGASYTTIAYKTYNSNGGADKNLSTTIPSLEGYTSNTIGAVGGIRFGIDLGKNLQMNVGYKLGYNLNTKIKDDMKAADGNKNLNINLENPTAITVGIRLFGF
jgi:hypothetical protein